MTIQPDTPAKPYQVVSPLAPSYVTQCRALIRSLRRGLRRPEGIDIRGRINCGAQAQPAPGPRLNNHPSSRLVGLPDRRARRLSDRRLFVRRAADPAHLSGFKYLL